MVNKNEGETLAVKLFGAFRLSTKQGEVAIASRGGRSLIACLALTEGYSENRARLIALLWPESHEDSARTSLRQSVFQAKRGLEAKGFDGLTSDRERIAIDGPIHTDLEEVQEALQRGEAPAMLTGVSRLGDQILARFTAPNDVFESWLGVRRREIEDQLRGAYLSAVNRARGIAKRELARGLVALDPTEETAVRLLMQAHLDLGDTGGALSAYKQLWDLLDEEFDTEPSTETQDLFASIKLGEPLAASQQAKTVQEMFTEIAVEPFETSSLHDADQALVSLFRNELITCLSRFREWRILDNPKHGDFNGYRLKAEASGDGHHIQLSIGLSSQSGSEIWRQSADSLRGSWIGFLRHIAGDLAAHLNLSLSHSRLSQLTGGRTATQSAIDRWLVAQSHLLSFSPQGWKKSIELNNAILAEHRGFSRAHTSLAQLYNIRNIVFPGSTPTPEDFNKALNHASKAIAKDPLDAQAHLCRGWSLTMQQKFLEASLSFHLAAEANPNDAWVIISSSLGLAYAGETENGLAFAKRALDLGWTILPRDWCYLATVYFLGGDYQACIDAAKKGKNKIGNITAWQAAALALQNDTAQAADAYRQFKNFAEGSWNGNQPPCDDSICNWFLSAFPIADETARVKLKKGLVIARTAYKGSPQSSRL